MASVAASSINTIVDTIFSKYIDEESRVKVSSVELKEKITELFCLPYKITRETNDDDEDEEVEELEVKEIELLGKIYYIDEKTRKVYDPNTAEVVIEELEEIELLGKIYYADEKTTKVYDPETGEVVMEDVIP